MSEPSPIKKVLKRLQSVKDNCTDKELSAVSARSAEFYRGYGGGAEHAMAIVIEELLD